MRPCFVAVGSAALQANGLPARVGLGRVQFLHPSDSGPAPLRRTSGNKAPHAPQQVNISTGPNDVCFKPVLLVQDEPASDEDQSPQTAPPGALEEEAASLPLTAAASKPRGSLVRLFNSISTEH